MREREARPPRAAAAALTVVLSTLVDCAAAVLRRAPDAEEPTVPLQLVVDAGSSAAPAGPAVALAHNATRALQAGNASALLPLVWLHIPKTGSSFATTLAHFGCPGIPASVTVKEVSWLNRLNSSGDAVPFFTIYPPNVWCPHSFSRFESGHAPIRPWEKYEHVVSMFRDPKRRLVSGYFHNFHDCPRLRRRHFCPEENCKCAHLYSAQWWRQKERLHEYSNCVSGCQALMLTGRPCGAHGMRAPAMRRPAAEAAALAAVERMGFVGLTEEWPMSVCLFHARFGGECFNASFKNVRPGKANHRYDTFVSYITWSMGADEALYSAARMRFWKDVSTHGVTPERCRTEICPTAAEFFEDGVSFEIEGDDDDI